MPQGGKREGAGRKKGVPNKVNKVARAKALKGGITPLEYALKIMRSKSKRISDERRDEMCRIAMPFVHSRLASVEHTGEGGGPIKTEDNVSPIEAARRVAFVLAQGARMVAKDSKTGKG